MSDYTKTKGQIPDANGTVSQVFHEHSIQSTWTDREPLITATYLRENQLWGIPLESAMRDSNGKRAVMTDNQLTERIRRAVNISETELKINIFPRQYVEKLPLEKPDWENWGYARLENRPVSSIEAYEIVTADNISIFQFALEWIDTARLAQGQITIVPYAVGQPLSSGDVLSNPQSTASGYFLSIIGNRHWVSSYFRAIYTAGFPDGQIPTIVNEYIGTVAAILVLSDLAATYAKSGSASIGMDGISQSASNPGPQLFSTKIEQLEKLKDKLQKEIKNLYGQTLFSGAL